jgi:glycosyltransferase involved in cell wall biosynthesis
VREGGGAGHGAHRPLRCLTTSYPSHAGDASGSFIAHLNAAFAQAGWAPRVICFGDPHLTRCPLYGFPLRAARAFGGISGAGGAPDWLQAHPVAALLSAPLSALTLALTVARAPSDPHEARVAHWLLPCALTPRAPHLAYAHGGDIALLESLPQGHALAQRIDERAARAGGTLNFVSQDLRARFEALTGAPCRAEVATLPMGVCDPRPCPRYAEALRRLAGGRLIIATVGRLTPIKGLDTLADALSALTPSERAGVVWLAAGEGPERPRLEALIGARALPAHLLGHLTPPQRDALLSAAAVFVQPSRQLGARVEGSPVSLMEAAVAGCALICTRAGGAPALALALNDALSAGLSAAGARVVEAEDPRGLAAALRALLALEGAGSAPEGARAREAEGRRAARAQAGARWRWSHLGPRHAALLARATGSPPLDERLDLLDDHDHKAAKA